MAGLTTWNKGIVPAGPDGWNLTPDVRKAIETLNYPVPVGTATERDGLTPPTGKYAGMMVVRTDLAGHPIEVWDGGKWVRQSIANIGQGDAVPVFAGGITTVTTNTNGDFTITLPSPFGTAIKAASIQDATDPATLGAVLIKVTMGTSDRTKITGRAYTTAGAALNTVTLAAVWTAFGY